MTLTPEERAGLRAYHHIMADSDNLDAPNAGPCSGCGWRWPCNVIRLLDALDAAEQRAARLAEALGRVEFQSTIHGGDSDGDGKIGHFLCPDCGADAFAGPSPTHRDWCHIAAALAAYRQQQEAQHGG